MEKYSSTSEWKFKWLTFPATGTADRPHDCAVKQNPQHWNRQLDNESENNYTTSAPGPVSVQKTSRKRKSPSTLKRDKRRRDTWLASKKGKSNGQNRQDSNDPVLSPIHTNDSNSIMEKFPIETEPLKAQKVENNDTETYNCQQSPPKSQSKSSLEYIPKNDYNSD